MLQEGFRTHSAEESKDTEQADSVQDVAEQAAAVADHQCDNRTM